MASVYRRFYIVVASIELWPLYSYVLCVQNGPYSYDLYSCGTLRMCLYACLYISKITSQGFLYTAAITV